MADQIRVLIVDDIPETRDHLTKLLGFESDIEVVGSAGSGPASAARTKPQSSALRHIGPSLSSVQQSAMAPCRLTRP